uniref:YCII-related domain-containing protein n=1 Tax=Cyclophora tenuis TaxID=216820 RepID=A0A7S1D9B1_CYCTE|mmetsp:Transcript_3837/g.6553  ORF Transcript_3837/g.6553 Transcript_3837/m.6553 type:complete len:130 (+) Transcript_3837:3-392(+)
MMFGVAFGRASLLAFFAGSRPMAGRHFTSSTALRETQYLLRYDYIPDVLEKRGPYREGHLGVAKDLIAEGKCLSGGPTGEVGMEVPTGALFVFTDEESAKLFVEKDPYVSAGIVTGHSIEEWNVVVQKE